MDFILTIFYIMVIAYSVLGFIVVKKHCKKWETIKDVIEKDEKLQEKLQKETKKIVVMVTVNIILIVLSTVTNLILIFLDV